MSDHDRDNDGDSQMLSSSSSSSEHMFPTSTVGDPPTPRNNASFSNYQGHTLSPPNSQNATMYAPEQTTSYETMDMDVAGGGIGQLIGGEEDLIGDGGIDEKKEPGWSWNNGKAREEYSRAMELVADKGFNLREFGDLYDEREKRAEG